MLKWRSLEKDFRDIPDSFVELRADWSDQPNIRNHWRLAGGTSREVRARFTAVATLAGKQLLSPSAMRSRLPPEVIAEADPVARWLTAVREVTGHFETGFYGFLHDEKGQPCGTLLTGSIHRVIEASALLCLQLAAEDSFEDEGQAGTCRLFVDDIDSFAPVRQVDSKDVLSLLSQGRLNVAEDEVQRCLESALGVPLHKKDWGGEENDLYTTNIVVDGHRVPVAFALKGRGQTAITLQLAHCGKNGDQIVRLFQSPAELFILQFVGMVSENIVKDMEGKARDLVSQKRPARFCVIDGQDTARLMRGFGRL